MTIAEKRPVKRSSGLGPGAYEPKDVSKARITSAKIMKSSIST
jgi:hypothetical protein